MENHIFYITCPFGVESVCKKEILFYNIENIRLNNGFLVVETSLDFLEIAKYLKSVNRIYYIIKKGEISSYDDIGKIFENLRLKDYFLNPYTKIEIDVITQNTEFYSKKTIKAIANRFINNKNNELKANDSFEYSNKKLEKNDICIFIIGNKIDIGFDCFGTSLHKRNYRLNGGISPLKENIASVLVINSIKINHKYLIDPFCGSGTILSEAILFIYNKKNPFLFSRIKTQKIMQKSVDSEKRISKIEPDLQYSINEYNSLDKNENFKFNEVISQRYNCKYFIGADIDEGAIENSKKNIERMLRIYFNNSYKYYRFNETDFQYSIYKVNAANNEFYIILILIDSYKLKNQLTKINLIKEMKKENSVIISNLPYGKRLDRKFTLSNSLAAIQRIFNDFECDKYFLSSMKYLPSLFNAKEKKKRKLYNGKVEVTLFSF